MTLSTLPPVLESAVEKMAKAEHQDILTVYGSRSIVSWEKLKPFERDSLLNDARRQVLAFLNALLADGKARISEVQHRDRSKPPGRRIIIITLE